MTQTQIILRVIGIVVLLTLYILIALFYDKLGPIHVKVRDFVMANRKPWLNPIMNATHYLNGAVWMSALTALVALLLGVYWGKWRDAFMMMMAMVGVTAIIHATKAVHKSNRPPQLIAEILMKTYSYPSGHSAASMTFALVVPAFLAFHLSTPIVVVIAIVLLLNALATAYGRMYLDMHWLADIIGGWCMAGIVFWSTSILLHSLAR